MKIRLPFFVAASLLAACAGHAAPTARVPAGVHAAAVSPTPTIAPTASPTANATAPSATPTVRASAPGAASPTPAPKLDELRAKLEAIAQLHFTGARALDVATQLAVTGVVANNGAGVVANNGAGIIANNGSGYHLLDTAISLVAGSGEAADGPIRWLDGTGLSLFRATGGAGRVVDLDAAGRAAGEMTITNLVTANGAVTMQVDQTCLLPPDEAFGEQLSEHVSVDSATDKATSEGGTAHFHNPTGNEDVYFDSYEADYVKGAASFKRRLTPGDLVEEGTFTPDITRLTFSFDDPLQRAKGESRVSTASGTPLYHRAQTASADGHVLTETYDLLDGFVLAFTNDDREPTEAPGTVTLNGQAAGTVTRTFAAGGTVSMAVSLTGQKDPVTVQLVAPQHPPATGSAGTLPYDLVTTICGSGTPGRQDGDGPAAAFKLPSSVVATDDDTLYVADTGNHRVCKLTRIQGSPTNAWRCTTFVGGAEGEVDGPGATAQLDYPTGLALGLTEQPNDTLYVSDGRGGCHIRAIRLDDPAHPVTTLAGSTLGYADGPGATAQFQKPCGLTVGPDGTLYVADERNYCVRTIRRTADGVVVGTLAGHPGVSGLVDGDGAAAGFGAPTDVTFDAARKLLWVADRDGQAVRAIDLSTAGHAPVRTVVGPGADHADGPAGTATSGVASGVHLDARGNLLVCDWSADRLRQVSPDGTVKSVAGRDLFGIPLGPASRVRIGDPWGVTVLPGGAIAFADISGGRVLMLYPAGSQVALPNYF